MIVSDRARVVSNDQAEVDDNSETTTGNFEWELAPNLSTENPETVSNNPTPVVESSIVQPTSEPPVQRSTRKGASNLERVIKNIYTREKERHFFYINSLFTL